MQRSGIGEKPMLVEKNFRGEQYGLHSSRDLRRDFDR